MSSTTHQPMQGIVLVQGNEHSNRLGAFGRIEDGRRSPAGSVETGASGNGTVQLQSQGSVTITGDDGRVLVTNAGSGDSVFSVGTEGLIRRAFLYALDADSGQIYGWSVAPEGAMTTVGSWGGLPLTAGVPGVA